MCALQRCGMGLGVGIANLRAKHAVAAVTRYMYRSGGMYRAVDGRSSHARYWNVSVCVSTETQLVRPFNSAHRAHIRTLCPSNFTISGSLLNERNTKYRLGGIFSQVED